jgi:alkylated DNA nucleotide flippase Atl1
VKGFRDMHFYEIVPVDHLLERLAQDRNCPSVCRSMAELLLNSFYPLSLSQSLSGSDTAAAATGTAGKSGTVEAEQLSRCLQFVKKCPLAAVTIYAHVHPFVPLASRARFVTMIFTYLVKQQEASLSAAAAAASATSAEGTGAGGEDNATGKRRRPATASKVRTTMFTNVLVLCFLFRIIFKCLIFSSFSLLPLCCVEFIHGINVRC